MKITEEDTRFMNMAADLAEKNIDEKGGPFAAIIVRNGKIIATGVNRVTANNDPTAHAEINAIRSACLKEENFKLTNCVIYSTCEPCPMCLSALYWAGISRIYYGNSQDDAEAINFSDKFIYKELNTPKNERMIPCIKMDNNRTIRAFEKWQSMKDKIEY